MVGIDSLATPEIAFYENPASRAIATFADHPPDTSSARGRNRTCDLSFRKALLYPLSYAGRVKLALNFKKRTSVADGMFAFSRSLWVRGSKP